MPESIEIAATGAAYVKNKDYILTFNDDAQMVVTSLKNNNGEFLCSTGVTLTVTAEKLDPALITVEDVIGGVDVQGNKSGFELINECFPRFRVTPGILLAPGFSSNATLAAIMATKASSINEVFKAICVIDVPTESAKR